MIGMSADSPAAGLVTAAARRALRPLGISRRGRSTLWLDDRGWWLGVVEFRPGSSAGNYLDIGVMFLWRDSDRLSFDRGGRDGDFCRFVDVGQFTQQIEELARRAAVIAVANRERFRDVGSAARFLAGQPRRRGMEFWDSYHAAIATGLAGDADASLRSFARVLAEDPWVPWVQAAQAIARELSETVTDPVEFRARVCTLIAQTRARLRLPACAVSFDSP
jgi:hypothetical protein